MYVYVYISLLERDPCKLLQIDDCPTNFTILRQDCAGCGAAQEGEVGAAVEFQDQSNNLVFHVYILLLLFMFVFVDCFSY